jgi:hypothetical protein
MAWILIREPGKPSKVYDPATDLELIRTGGGPGYTGYIIVPTDDHAKELCSFGSGMLERPATAAEKRAQPGAEAHLTMIFNVGRPMPGYTLAETHQIVRDAVMAEWRGMNSPLGLRKYILEIKING